MRVLAIRKDGPLLLASWDELAAMMGKPRDLAPDIQRGTFEGTIFRLRRDAMKKLPRLDGEFVGSSSSCIVSDYQNAHRRTPLVEIYGEGFKKICFGYKKALAILTHLDDLIEFIEAEDLRRIQIRGGDNDTSHEPYITKSISRRVRLYNPHFGDEKLCKCGHEYGKHFDWMEDEDERGVDCKHCDCCDFVSEKG